MLFKLSEEYKGIEKEYKAKLIINTPIYWENAEKEKSYTDNMFQQMLEELNEMETKMLINNKETKVKLKIEKNAKCDIFLFISMDINREKYKYTVEKNLEEKDENKDIIELIHIESVIYDFKQQI